MIDIPEAREFLALDTTAVAELVRSAGIRVCVWPIDGTRRWFALENRRRAVAEGAVDEYFTALTKRYLELYRMVFEHGINTLLTPVFGPDVLERGGEYNEIIAGLSLLAKHEAFLSFYRDNDVRVRFYGEYHRYFDNGQYEELPALFDALTSSTSENKTNRIFYGLFAQNATETIARIGAEFWQEHNRPPTRSEIITAYYGEPVPNVDLFVGFGKFKVFDYPLLASGDEDLYFTVCPSTYTTVRQWREILYDVIIRRGEVDYKVLNNQSWETMDTFYQANVGQTQGIGTRRDGIWYPLPQVELPWKES